MLYCRVQSHCNIIECNIIAMWFSISTWHRIRKIIIWTICIYIHTQTYLCSHVHLLIHVYLCIERFCIRVAPCGIIIPLYPPSVLFYSVVLWKRPGQHQSPAILVSLVLLSSVLPHRILEWLGWTEVSRIHPAGDPVTGDGADPVVTACSDFRCTAAVLRLGLPWGRRDTGQTMNF